ncbi:hypothetical protein CC78DRAFT_481000 [Lojkania enalia]|uniref:Rhodopsin domain-containing protein n=1 Tax=Lojkania enalia TaxID=147567 RepID=A0A9P4N467_9PLEO|nr:hypothetical protein CC78DRAFT_481000 [Didymosphaeria enalia]
MLEGPALEPPLGVVPNFENPPNDNGLRYGVVVTCCFFIVWLVCSRIYSKIVYHKRVDGVYGGWVWSSLRVMVQFGIFVHQWDVRFKNLPEFLFTTYVGSACYSYTITLLQIGILTNWANTFVPKGTRDTFWWTCYVVMVADVCFHITGITILLLQCSPRRKIWQRTIAGRCLDAKRLYVGSASINFTSDVIILLLPQKVIWSLNTSRKKKIGIAFLFAAGICACVAAGFRIPSAIRYATEADIVYNTSDIGKWCYAEMASGFFILCLPALPKLFRDSPYVKKIFSNIKSFAKSAAAVKRAQGAGGASYLFGGKREPDASLFTDSDHFGLMVLPNVKVTMEFDWQSERVETTSNEMVYDEVSRTC